MKNISNDHR